MISIMDKNGRVICLTANFYNEDGSKTPKDYPYNAATSGNSFLSAEETVAEMLRKLPDGELIRPPVINPKAKSGS